MSLSPTWIPRALRAHIILLLTACALAPTLGFAQQSLEDQALQQEGLTRAAAGWGGAVGAGLGDSPKYPGASRERIRLTPLFSVRYGNRLFAGPLGIGLVAVRRDGFRAGPVLGYQRGRAESDDPHLFGLGDIPASVTAGVFAGYARGPFQISATARQAISHSSNGLEGLLQVNVRHVSVTARTLLALGPDLEFGNGEFERTWFGISAAQALTSGLPVYMPHAGIDRVGLHAGLTHRVSQHILWRVFARLSEITGDAAQSPIVERRTQVVVGAGIAYHF
jgi:outer membrane protein